VPKIVQVTQNKSLTLKPNPMTYNPHQNSTFKRNISRIMRKLQAMHSHFAHAHFMHISHLNTKPKIHIYLQNKKLTIGLVKQEITSKFARNWKLND